MRSRSIPCLLATLSLPVFLQAAEPGNLPVANTGKPPNSPTEDPRQAMKLFRVQRGLDLNLFAAEPLIQNVVSFSFDENGRVYVVETGRRRSSVYDIRGYRGWVDDDMALRTTEQRAAFLREKLNAHPDQIPQNARKDFNRDGKFDARDLEVESERIRLIWDSDQDGLADRGTTYAENFSTIISGVAAGVLARRGEVYFTCIPDLWRLADLTGDGVSDSRKLLHSGFGVHVAFGGHDMHGLKFGPDGKLYWSIADRGYGPPPDIRGHGFTTEFLRRILPDTGTIFRCDPDGSNLEIVAVGMRNPQELAFDQHGNLFTGDNNADGGDKARWVYVVEGADYGWRYGWQHLPKLGAWNSELLWGLLHSNSAASILPPVAHIGHGPAGIAYYPGTGLPERFDQSFFMTDFPGGVRHFKVQKSGAGFTVENPKDYLQDNSGDQMNGKLVWGLYPVDIEFGPDGGAYVLDWVFGWEKTGKGRIYRIHDSSVDASSLVKETKAILAEGFAGRSSADLAGLLEHRDQRVRQEAQFELAQRGSKSFPVLLKRIKPGQPQLARIHAIWGIGQIARQSEKAGNRIRPVTQALDRVASLLSDQDSEIRAQAAKILGDVGHKKALPILVSTLSDSEPRVQFFAAQSIGKLGGLKEVEPVTALLRSVGDRDFYLRHAAVQALSPSMRAAWKELSSDPDPAVRMGALLAMRSMEMEEIKLFLQDNDPMLVLEAARAINDLPVESAMNDLAGLISNPDRTEPVLRRVINANFRLGTPSQADALSQFATNGLASVTARVEAMSALSDWAKPSGRDRIVGLWRPLTPAQRPVPVAALENAVNAALHDASAVMRVSALEAARKNGIYSVAGIARRLALDAAETVEVQTAAIEALAAFKDPELQSVLLKISSKAPETLRKLADKLLRESGGGQDLKTLAAKLDNGSISERQSALQQLAKSNLDGTDQLLKQQFGKLLDGTLPKELWLDLLETIGMRSEPHWKKSMEEFEAKRPKTDPLELWKESLAGGDPKLGRAIFYERAEAGCLRCHKVGGEGGDVGPVLSGKQPALSREQILESVLLPNKKIAQGFETAIVTTKSGVTTIGTLKFEDSDKVVLASAEDGIVTIKKSDIESRTAGLSPMPEGMGEILTKRELRDLVEFLAGQN